MKTVILKLLAGSLPDKIRVTQALVKYDQDAGLKVAKQKVDLLMSGTPVKCAVEEAALSSFEAALSTLKIKYETV